jgi:hypothetical protein
MDITQTFDKGLDSKMGASESEIAKQFKDPY